MRDPDPKMWSDTDVAEGLNALAIPECVLFIHRADRHNRASEIQAVTLHTGVLSYDSITQIAGLFETPHITFAPSVRFEVIDDHDKPCACEHCAAPYTEIIVRWEAAPPASKVPA